MKKLKLIIVFVIILNVTLLFIIKNNNVNEPLLESENNTNVSGYSGLAIMLEDEEGNYKLSDSNDWPSDGYEFNATLSKCENGGKLSWNSETKSIELRTKGSDKCYVYFDKIPISLADVCPNGGNFVECIKALQSKNPNQQETGIYFHDKAGKLANGAQDNSYRYAGDNPNNFVCFGSDAEECPEANMYRIIGVFNIDSSEKVKLIKSEYLTTDDGVPTGGKIDFDNSLTNLKRVQNVPSVGFLWNEERIYNWETASLKSFLNDESAGYLNKLGTTWAAKIATSTWYVSGHSTNKVTAKQMRDAEMGSNKTVTAKVGLMYASDYGFATTNDNGEWAQTLANYDNGDYASVKNKNRENNWLFNGVSEWLISPELNGSGVFEVSGLGSISPFEWVDRALFAVRPCFYLESSVSITSDGNDGSHEKPYRIVLD